VSDERQLAAAATAAAAAAAATVPKRTSKSTSRGSRPTTPSSSSSDRVQTPVPDVKLQDVVRVEPLQWPQRYASSSSSYQPTVRQLVSNFHREMAPLAYIK